VTILLSGLRLAAVVLVAALVTAIVSLAGSSDGPASANHPYDDDDPNFNWVYIYTMWDFYALRDHDLSFRVCTSYGNEAGYAAWDWMEHRFGFNPSSELTSTREYNCGVATDALFWLTSDSMVNSVCKDIVFACFVPIEWEYDSARGRDEVKRVDILVKKSYMDSVSQSARIHLFEHELGHGFGLAHHTTCTSVMVDQPICNWWVGDAEIDTARCIYIYLC